MTGKPTADVTDGYDGGGTCTVTGGDDVVVPAGGSVTLGYSCTFTTKPTYTGTNTSTATWDAATYFTPTGTASGTAAVTAALSGETHRTITVVDDKTDPLNPVTLGTSDYYAGPFQATPSSTCSALPATAGWWPHPTSWTWPSAPWTSSNGASPGSRAAEILTARPIR